jgi:hypothetical protein
MASPPRGASLGGRAGADGELGDADRRPRYGRQAKRVREFTQRGGAVGLRDAAAQLRVGRLAIGHGR